MNESNGSGDRAENTAFDYLLETDREFYPTESRYLARVAAGMGVPPPEVERVVGETWLEAVKNRNHFTGDEIKQRLHHWLMKAVRGKAVDALRRLGRHPCESLGAREEQLIDDTESRNAESSELQEWFDALLDKVSPGHDESVRLFRAHYVEGLSIQELAERFGMTTDAVDSRIRRVREKVRELVQSYL